MQPPTTSALEHGSWGARTNLLFAPPPSHCLAQDLKNDSIKVCKKMEYGRVKSHQENLRQMETQEVWVVTTGLQDVSRLGSAPRGKMGVWRCPSGGSRNLLPKKAHVLKDAEVVGACILLRGDPHNAGPTTGQTREPQALLEDCGWHKASFRSASPSAPHPLLARCVCPRREDLGTTHIDSGASRRSSLPSFHLMGA